MRIRFALVVLGLALIVVIAAENAVANQNLFNEVRFGVYEHDTGIIGQQKESGVDFSFEVLSRPILPLSILAPRIVVGGAINSEGQTNQIYAGFLHQWDFVSSVFAEGDALFVEGMVGIAWHDGKIDVTGTPLETEWKSHGSRFLIRSGVDIGYRINSTWSVAVSFNHISNGDLATKNEGSNDLGLRIGMQF